MIDPFSKDQEYAIMELLKKALSKEGYTIQTGHDSTVRVAGVSEGELFIALRCRVFKKEKIDDTEDSEKSK